MKRSFIMVFALGILMAMPAMALDLQSARSQGIVGEKNDGYIAALKPSAEAGALVSEVNAKRRAEYSRISKENGQPVGVVGKVAAEQIINDLPAGAKYQDASGSWKTR